MSLHVNVGNVNGNDVNADDVNNLHSRIIFYLESQKIKVISDAMFQKGRQPIQLKKVAEDFCTSQCEIFRSSEVLSFLERYCRDTYELHLKSVKDSQVLQSRDDLGLYTDERARERANQLFFCDGLRNNGYILTKSGDSYVASERQHSLDVFRKDLDVLGEDAYKSWAHRNLIVGSYEYTPFGPIFSQNKSKVYMLNTYNMPEWSAYPIRPMTWEELPPLLRCFYIHLIPDPIQRHYALNWMACSIQCTRMKRAKPKLSTYLTMIGEGGIGKGICIENHMRYLHGTLNYISDKTKSIGDRFSVSAYLNKTLVHFSEAAILSEDAYDAMKSLESVFQGIEFKNQTSELKKTYFNVVWACNNKHRMRYLSQNDRRFAILDVTEDFLKDKSMYDEVTGEMVKFTEDKLGELSSSPEILTAFVEYILSLEPDFALAERPLKDTLRYREVLKASRHQWVEELLEALEDIDMESPAGSDTQLGFAEIEGSNDQECYYTYQVPAKSIMRIIDKVTTSRRTVSLTKSRIHEELKKVSREDIHSYMVNGSWVGVRIRHKNHSDVKPIVDRKCKKAK